MLVPPLKTSKMLPVYGPIPYITLREGGEVTSSRDSPWHTITLSHSSRNWIYIGVV